MALSAKTPSEIIASVRGMGVAVMWRMCGRATVSLDSNLERARCSSSSSKAHRPFNRHRVTFHSSLHVLRALDMRLDPCESTVDRATGELLYAIDFNIKSFAGNNLGASSARVRAGAE
jgi:hypothetical protein